MKIFFSILVMCTSCASLIPRPNAKEVAAEQELKEEKPVQQPFKSEEWSMAFTFAKKKRTAQVLTCKPEKTSEVKIVFAHHRDDKGWDPKVFCQGWVAQAFLREGYTVVGMNRPGYVATEGDKDYVGAESQAALTELSIATRGKYKIEKLAGAWGYESGALAAAIQARSDKNFSWVVMGGSAYDFEQVDKQKFPLWNKVKAWREKEGEIFYELRSIAFDTQGLPKKIALYHAATDEVVSVDHARAFRDSLKTNEFQVSFDELASGHEIAPEMHYKQLRKIIHML